MIAHILLYIHILSVIMSIGPFFILIPMVKKLRDTNGDVQQAHIQTFRSAVRLAKHAGHVLVVSGLLLILATPWTWKAPWILTTVAILICSLYFLARAFSPLLKQFGIQETDEAEVAKKLSRSIWIYILLLLAMLWLMVAKPVLW
ncbi:DUF2269 family protein [Falsibacillus albus]|uniref:DUF2269 family protein n=1 Tax=Falsibacillus albus TaxID=2478915 RepID=A0A3L7JVB4_9BACI|nr:DUF2269 family protein [Falsibacillus albus]RLQ94059.1 DUF2269 family protein [Falsibacillus albus]